MSDTLLAVVVLWMLVLTAALTFDITINLVDRGANVTTVAKTYQPLK